MDELQAFSLGHLPDDIAEPIAVHAETCETCRRLLEQFERSGDELTRVLKAMPAKTPQPDSAAFLALEAKLLSFSERSRTVMPTEATAEGVPQPFGPYDLFKQIGRGGMGEVYLARHRALDRLMAVKLVRREYLQGEHASPRFRQEIKAFGMVHHPHVVVAHDAGEIDGQLYLAMEFVPGENLSQLIKRRGPLPVSEAIDYILQAAEGLQAVHDAGLIHRDIKPPNLIITPNDQIKVLDLGLARLHTGHHEHSELTNTGQILGTIEYMAPEQLDDSRRVDQRADVYSLAATLYKLLTGRSPFAVDRGRTPLQLLRTVLAQTPIRLDAIRADVPKSMADVVERALSKDAVLRPATAVEFGRLLADALPKESSSTSGPPLPPDNSAQENSPRVTVFRNLSRKFLAFACLIMLVLGGIWQFWPRQVAQEIKQSAATGKVDSPAPASLTESPAATPTELSSVPAPETQLELKSVKPVDPAQRANPLDGLSLAQLPAENKRPWHPAELVAILGDEDHTHWNFVSHLSFSPDDKLLATSGYYWNDSKPIEIWDCETFTIKSRIVAGNQSPNQPVRCVHFLPDGTLLTVEYGGMFRLWNVQQNPAVELRAVNPGHLGDHHIIVSPQGNQFAAVKHARREIWVFPLDFDKLVPKHQLPFPQEFDLPFAQIKFSSNGDQLYAADRYGRTILWDLSQTPPTERASRSLGDGRELFVSTISPDFRYVAYQQYGSPILKFWDVIENKDLPNEISHVSAGEMCFYGSGRHLLKFGDNDLFCYPDILEAPKTHDVGKTNISLHLQMCAVSPQEKFAAATSHDGQRVRLWRREGDRFVTEVHPSFNPTAFRSLAFPADGTGVSTLANVDNYHSLDFQLWSVEGSHLRQTMTRDVTANDHNHKPRTFDVAEPPDFDNATAFARHSQFPLSEANDISAFQPPHFRNAIRSLPGGSIRWYSTSATESATPGPTEWAAHTGDVWYPIFSPDGRRLATFGMHDRLLRVWDTSTVPPRLEKESALPRVDPTAAPFLYQVEYAFSPDGERLAVTSDGLWEWNLSESTPQLLTPAVRIIRQLANLVYSPDGKQLLITGTDSANFSVALWNLESRRLESTWKLPGLTSGAKFAKDGRHIGWINDNGSAYILRLQPGTAPADP